MRFAVFARPVVTIYDLPQTTKESDAGTVSTIGDEGLYGQVCQVCTTPGGTTADGVRLPEDMAEVVTFYGYHGYVFMSDLYFLAETDLRGYLDAAQTMTGRATDVLSLPKVQGVRLLELERGAVLRTVPEDESHDGWAKVRLVDGTTGYVRDVALEPVRYPMTAVRTQKADVPFEEALAQAEGCRPEELTQRAIDRWFCGEEAAFRNALAEQAKRYLGTEYRWGGKSGRGIDCSGLVSSAYMQCGVLIYRDAKLVEGWPMHEIPRERIQRGDALYFPGHIALYLGEGRYIHSTGAAKSGGVVLNSLDPHDPLYREDLVKSLYAVGSLF